MLDTATCTRLERIDSILRNLIGEETGTIAPDQDLETLGLTSIGMVNLMLSIEAEFDLTIPGAKLVPANFRTLARIEALLCDLGR